MDIRPERPQDWRKVENLTREAFWNIYRPGCTEHLVLNQFSKDEDCGRNADGSINFDYCQYCYQDGRFLQECS